jgi:hypothetical protein
MADPALARRVRVEHLVDLDPVVRVRVDLVDRVPAVDPVVQVDLADLVVQVVGPVVPVQDPVDPEVDRVPVVVDVLPAVAVDDDVVVRMISSPE